MRFAWRTVILGLCAGSAAACASDPHDHRVALSLTNLGDSPLRCRMQFGHWVDRDLGELAPGAVTGIAMMRAAADGALYVSRGDGRKMMIETVQCARPGDWLASFSQVDLGPMRAGRARVIEASCAAPVGPGRVSCSLDRME